MTTQTMVPSALAPRALTDLEWRGIACCLVRRGLVRELVPGGFNKAVTPADQDAYVDQVVARLQPSCMGACFPHDAPRLMGMYLVCQGPETDPNGEFPPMAMWAVETDRDRETELGTGMPDFDVRPWSDEL